MTEDNNIPQTSRDLTGLPVEALASRNASYLRGV